MPKVAVILINYQDYARRFLIDCRDSLRQIDFPKDQHQVFIVDNGTSAESQKYLAEIYPEAIILPNQKNVGWGEGNNTAIRRSLKEGFDFFVLLNMDTVVDPGWLKELVAVTESDGRIGIAQSKILLWRPLTLTQGPAPARPGCGRPQGEREFRINSLGNLTHFLGFGFCDGYGEPDIIINGTPEITSASGSSMLVKKAVFDKVGLFDPELFMYHDDAEICLKARLSGFKIVLAPRSVIYHKYEFGRSVKQAYYLERNRLLIIFEVYRLATIILILPALLAMEAGLWFYALFNGLLGTKIRVLVYFLKPASWRHLLTERRRIQALRQISDRELTKNFVGKIEFQEVYNPVIQFLVNPVFHAYWAVVRKLIRW